MNSNALDSTSRSTDIDPVARSLIRHKVRRIVLKHKVPTSDADDLAQDLALHAHVTTSKYDARRGAITTFYNRIINRKIASLFASRSAQKRDVRREKPLDDVLESRQRPDTDLRIDVRNALLSLPPDLHAVATLFMNGNTEADVIRRLGHTRQRVRGMRRRIADHLRQQGLSCR